MSWYECSLLAFLGTIGWFIWLELGSIRNQIRRVADALGEPKPGSSFYGDGGLRDIAKAIRDIPPGERRQATDPNRPV